MPFPFPVRQGKAVVFLAILLAPVLPLGYLALTQPHGIEGVLAPGPLTPGHAGLGCRACHVEAWREGKKAIGLGNQAGAAMDRACAGCHGGTAGNPSRPATPPAATLSVAAPPVVAIHSDIQLPELVNNCAECHQEHQGERVRLRTTDRHCVRCHANLQTTTRTTRLQQRITGFDNDHPPFSHWSAGTQREGRLWFDHPLHLKTETCADCHAPDASGRYMLPIRYASHCARCHPLSVQSAGARECRGVAAFRREPVPHAEPVLVRDALRTRLSALALQHPELLERPANARERPLPGMHPGRPAPTPPRDWVRQQLAHIERTLYDAAGGCRYCHIEKDSGARAGRLPHYEPTRIPERWFPYAEFSHARHATLGCVDCHPSVTSTRTGIGLLPDITRCVACHSNGGNPRKARADCLECHRYHQPPAPPARASGRR
jgi:hypothetical protein